MPFGPPKILRTDGETAILKSKEFQNLFRNFNTQHAPTAAASPWSNGLAERTVAKYKEQLRIHSKAQQSPHLSDKLAIIANSFNNTPTSYGPTPADLMFGFSNTHYKDLLGTQQTVKNHKEYLDLVQQNISHATKQIEQKREKNLASSTEQQNKRRQSRQFHKNQLVFVRNTVIAGESSMTSKQLGPFIINDINDSNHTAQLTHTVTGNKRKSHFDHLIVELI